MNKKIALSVLALSVFNVAFADNDVISNVEIVRNGADIDISWDNPDWEGTDVTGISVQWAERSSDIGPGEPTDQRLANDRESLTVWGGGFKVGTPYYFQINGFFRGGYKDRDTILVGCSPVIYWIEREDGTTTTSTQLSTCSDLSDYNGYEDELVDDEEDGETTASGLFGAMQIKSYANDIHLSWKPITMSDDDYDGVEIWVSKEKDMENPVLKVKATGDDRSARIKNAVAGEKYYVQGVFYRQSKYFGHGAVQEVQMLEAFTPSQAAKYERLVKNNLIKLQADVIADMDEGGNVNPILQTGNSTDDDPNTEINEEKLVFSYNPAGSTLPTTINQNQNTTTETQTTTTTTTNTVNYSQSDSDINEMSKNQLNREITETRRYLRALLKRLRELN